MIKKILLVSAVLLSLCAIADEKEPIIDIGGGVGYVSTPHYLGSTQRFSYTIPYVYFYYESENLRIDRSDFEAYIWQKDKWLLDWSFSGGLALDSSDNKLREGLDDLDWVGEVGPELRYFISGELKSDNRFSVAFTFRNAIATDLKKIEYVGEILAPSIEHRHQFSWSSYQIILTTTVQVVFADSDYQQYYWGVPATSQSTLPTFTSKSGYNSTRLGVGLEAKNDKLWVGAFTRVTNFTGSSQQDSPLIVQNNSWLAAIAITQKFDWF